MYTVNVSAIGFKYGSISEIMTFVVRLIVSFTSFAFFVMLLYGAFKYITSQGDKQAVGEAQKTITSALIGIILTATFFALMTLLQTVFGVKLVDISL